MFCCELLNASNDTKSDCKHFTVFLQRLWQVTSTAVSYVFIRYLSNSLSSFPNVLYMEKASLQYSYAALV